MGDTTKIEWCDATFNPWIGCQKVSPGCDHCYAETLMDKRYHKVEWGPHGERKRTSAANWRKPRQWAKAAHGINRRPRVFCASLADVFDNQVPTEWRTDLFDMIAATPELDWLLLTKRPQNFPRMFPTGQWPNIWLGITAEDQERYDERWCHLYRMMNVPVRFISHEPAIGCLWNFRTEQFSAAPDWVIVGGESGRDARMMNPDWARTTRNHCAAFGIAFFMKQMARKAPIPPDLMVRQFPR